MKRITVEELENDINWEASNTHSELTPYGPGLTILKRADVKRANVCKGVALEDPKQAIALFEADRKAGKRVYMCPSQHVSGYWMVKYPETEWTIEPKTYPFPYCDQLFFLKHYPPATLDISKMEKSKQLVRKHFQISNVQDFIILDAKDGLITLLFLI